jgi:hypothetical protein
MHDIFCPYIWYVLSFGLVVEGEGEGEGEGEREREKE